MKSASPKGIALFGACNAPYKADLVTKTAVYFTRRGPSFMPLFIANLDGSQTRDAHSLQTTGVRS